jgi:hypothetical protein
MVEVSANVIDPNVDDQHSFDWSETHASLTPNEGYHSVTFTFDPFNLPEGIFNLSVGVTDDGIGLLSTSTGSLVRVVSNNIVLSESVDSDNDGASDADEGFSDSDMDRVPDYLDALDEINQLSAGGAVAQTDVGMNLILGETAFASNTANAAVTLQDLYDHGGNAGGVGENSEDNDYLYLSGIFDFEVTGAVQGESVRVVLPQLSAIPANAIYRKYIANIGWFDFVETPGNSVASAPGSLGICPAPSNSSYTQGLSEGDFCVQLTIQDGGPNDTDKEVNGTVKDPGGIAVAAIPQPTVELHSSAISSPIFNAGDGEQVVLNFMLTSDSTDAQLEELSINGSGNINEAEDIAVVSLYKDDNKNGIPEAGERVASGNFSVDNGEVTFNLLDAYQLPVGDTHFLITYLF